MLGQQACCTKNKEAFFSAKLEKGDIALLKECQDGTSWMQPGDRVLWHRKGNDGHDKLQTQTVCVSLLHECAGDLSVKRFASRVNLAREVKVPTARIKDMIDVLVKIADAGPEGKIRRLTGNGLDLRRRISDASHRKIIDNSAPLINGQ
jgi:hypothetical protein